VTLGGLLFALLLGLALATGRPAALRALGMGAPLLMLAAALLQLAIQYHASALRAAGGFGTVSRAAAAQVLIGAALGVALVGRFGIDGLLWGWLAGTLAALALLRRRAPVPLVPAGVEVGMALVRAGFPVFAFFTASLVLRSVDRLALIHYSLGLMAAGLVLYLPESAGSVLYPRVAAAARTRPAPAAPAASEPGWARVLLDVMRAQRALAVALPLLVAVAMLWAGPVVALALPAYREAVPALRLLAVGALLLAPSTIPGYFLLGSGHAPRLLAFGAAAAALAALLVFGVAARAPRPVPVALASAAGYAGFGLGLVVLAARELCAPGAERRRFVAASFVPPAASVPRARGPRRWRAASWWSPATCRRCGGSGAASGSNAWRASGCSRAGSRSRKRRHPPCIRASSSAIRSASPSPST